MKRAVKQNLALSIYIYAIIMPTVFDLGVKSENFELKYLVFSKYSPLFKKRSYSVTLCVENLVVKCLFFI